MSKLLKVYVAGKYSATSTIEALQNIGRGQKICTLLFSKGYAPFCPWHDSSYIIDNPDIQYAVNHFQDVALTWLASSDVMFILSGSDSSKGVQVEIEFAKENDIPIFYTITALNLYKFNLLHS